MLLLLASVLWSLSGVVVKIVKIDPVPFAFWRSLAAGLAIAPLIRLSRQSFPTPRWMLPGILIYTAVVSLLVVAMTRSTAATGILLQYTGPAFCALLAWLLQGRRISKRTALVIAIALLGVAIMVFGGDRSGGWIGPICGTLSGMAFGGLILVLEKLDQQPGGKANPFAIVAFNNLGCALLLVPVALLLNSPLGAQPWQIGLVVACGVIQLGIPYVLFQLGLRHVSAVDASLLILLEPVLNPFWVALMTQERPDIATVIGGFAILFAMVLEATSQNAR